MTLQELQHSAHALAKEKGWWDGERDTDEVFALMHSEVSEALEEWRTGRPITDICMFGDWKYGNRPVEAHTLGEVEYLPDGRLKYREVLTAPCFIKPTGFFVELADLVIRIADAAQAWGRKLRCEADVVDEEKTVAALVCVLHGKIHHARYSLEYHQDGVADLAYAVELCFDFAKRHNVDLWRVIELKQAYNRTREKRHGGKIA